MAEAIIFGKGDIENIPAYKIGCSSALQPSEKNLWDTGGISRWPELGA